MLYPPASQILPALFPLPTPLPSPTFWGKAQKTFLFSQLHPQNSVLALLS